MNEPREYTKDEVLQSLQDALGPEKPPEGAICCKDIMESTGCKKTRSQTIMNSLIAEGWRAFDVRERFSKVRYILPPDRTVNVTHAKNTED
jgi:hypothetical protein